LTKHELSLLQKGTFSDDERLLLTKHLWFYRELMNNPEQANTREQINFLRVFKRGFPAKSAHELAFKKYLDAVALEVKEEELRQQRNTVEQLPEGMRPVRQSNAEKYPTWAEVYHSIWKS
jgi:hypothetical protein